MITSIEILGTEELLLERNPRAAAVHQGILETGRAAVIAVNERYDDTAGESALERLDTELDAILKRSLDQYARDAKGLFKADDLELWTAKITRVSGSYVGRAAAVGVPGALLLLEGIEEAEANDPYAFVSLDDTLANGAEYCPCGYASSRAVPDRLCRLCSGAVLNEWKAEEDRLLAGSPKVDADLQRVFDEVLDELAEAHLSPSGTAAALSVRRRAGEGAITRVNEARADEIALLDLARWRELSELNRLSQVEVVRAHGKYWSRWGLGSARLTTLAQESTPELQARMRLVAGRRPAPKPSLFERLFSRK
ncbi:hypothetical protein N1029_18820 [Herbiconiux sp. CPCC 203406]|uniref:hypothetical protein n=1 Tax=Herbiconiux oxytropis TaxID=2970915 RepID=UPI00217D281F|nr:hypothetical protein [Herbiconiux oxytropis]MCS5724052.1 hypothetical protein [Herbiconiux oxytropis]